ncbi:MAG: hypothetical protein AAB839_01865 [Patescibacteria group bacterium]
MYPTREDTVILLLTLTGCQFGTGVEFRDHVAKPEAGRLTFSAGCDGCESVTLWWEVITAETGSTEWIASDHSSDGPSISMPGVPDEGVAYIWGLTEDERWLCSTTTSDTADSLGEVAAWADEWPIQPHCGGTGLVDGTDYAIILPWGGKVSGQQAIE